jgi:hypothetical protein
MRPHDPFGHVGYIPQENPLANAMFSLDNAAQHSSLKVGTIMEHSDLVDRLGQLEREVALLTQLLGAKPTEEQLHMYECTESDDAMSSSAPPANGERQSESGEPIDRRRLLKRFGAAAAGVVAASAVRPDAAAAANGDAVIIGSTNSGSAHTALNVGPPIGTDLGTFAASVQANSAPFINGMYMAGSNIGAIAFSNRLALALSSPASHLRLYPQVNPVTEGANLLRGEIRNDTNGNVWYQHTDGPGNATKIVGPNTAGALHLIDPWRSYDSRLSIPGRVLVPGSTSTHTVVAPASYSGVASPIPAGAKGVVGTLSVADTQGSIGYLTAVAGDVTSTPATSILWFGANQFLSTGFTSRLSSSGTLKVFNNGPSVAAFIIDIVGYYR